MKRLLLVAAVSVGIAWKVERVNEVCPLTGTTREYSRYFRVFTTHPRIERTWIEEILEANGRYVPKTGWSLLSRNHWTLLGGINACGRSPITYSMHSFSLADLRERFSEEELLSIADLFLTGDKGAQEEARDAIYRRYAYY